MEGFWQENQPGGQGIAEERADEFPEALPGLRKRTG